jgi:hypothetical protein
MGNKLNISKFLVGKFRKKETRGIGEWNIKWALELQDIFARISFISFRML